MSKSGAVMTLPSSSELAGRKNSLGWLAQNWDILAVLLLLLASLPLAWISPQTRVLITQPGMFDDHWVLDAAYKVTHGIYFARNVTFLYGPLAHWLMAAPPRLAGLSLGSIYSSYRIMLLWCAVAFTWLALRLLLSEQPAWKRFLLTLLMGIFWTSWDGRTALGLLMFAAFLRGWYAVRESRVRPLPFACASALLIAIGFWYSADTGTYGVAAWLLAMCGVAWEHRRETQKLRMLLTGLAAFVASMVVVVLLTNVLTSFKLFDFHFWRTSLALVSVHRWNEAAGMTAKGELHLLVPLLVAVPLFLLRGLVRPQAPETIVARTGFLLSAFAFAVLSMQSGLVRADTPHIIAGVYPLVFFAAVILFSFRSKFAAWTATVVAVAGSLLSLYPIPEFQPAGMRFRLARVVHPMTTCPAGYREVDRACFPDAFADTLETGVNYLQQHSSAGDDVLIYPYQYMFAVAARREVAGDVEQSFLAAGPYLSQVDIAGMQRAKAPAGLFFRDATPREYRSGVLSLPIDEVSNFTRTPEVWFWVFRNYRMEQPLAPGVIGLARDDARSARISMQQYPLGLPARTFDLQQSDAELDLGAPAWPTAGADFLRLRMRVRYGPLWKLRKPERLQLEITRADGSRSLRSFVIEPNVSSEVWFYPWDEADLLHYFDSDEARWRSGARPAITNLRLIVDPFDWFSQPAKSVTIESADAVRVDM